MAKTVFVNCSLPSGLRLTSRIDGKNLTDINHVTLHPGQNEIDADFWFAWTKDNADYAPFKSGFIVGPDAPAPAPAAKPAPEPAPDKPEGNTT